MKRTVGYRYNVIVNGVEHAYSGIFRSLKSAKTWYEDYGQHLENYYFGKLFYRRKLKLSKVIRT